MKYRLIVAGAFALVIMGGINLLSTAPAAADSLSIAPLHYKAKLAAGESKKGMVDITNPSAKPVEIQLHVQAFRQIDDNGGLEFYDSAEVAKGVKLDLTSIALGPHEGARIYFILDGNLLPSGDVFAAILANTVSDTSAAGSIPAAEVGTLLLLENGTPPKHHAKISSLNANWLQFGDAITMEMSVTNTDPAGGVAIGFVPQITFLLKPHGGQTVDGPLLFAGRTRAVDYRHPGDYFGPILLHAEIGGHSQTKLIFAVTGYWRWLAPLLFVLGIAAIFIGRSYHKHSRKKHSMKTPVVKN